MIADASQRRQAIDVRRSFIVQAPAGSGKTELLIQRLLALLAEVERPNQILAITFTRKAAGEMRHRLLEALAAGQREPCPQQQHAAKTWNLARAALARQGEELLRNPSLLSIQTIDSFNATLVRRMPWLSRFGDLPEMADDPDALYRQAAEQLLGQLDSSDPAGQQLRLLLTHLDNQVGRLQEMLVDMLRRRDQWLRHLLPSGQASRQQLEHGLARLIGDQLKDLLGKFPHQLTNELLCCVDFAAQHLCDDSILSGLSQLPGVTVADLSSWHALAEFLLTGKDELRKTVTVSNGFPAGSENTAGKKRMIELLTAMSEADAFVTSLARVRKLTASSYRDSQWQILQALVNLLPLLVAELWLVFRARGRADYAATALQAMQALGEAENPSELLLRTDNDLHHILVDEFQDTSWLQYELLTLLTSGWSTGDGRTLFLVGDPMQSIYRFREAEVGLFLKTFAGGLGDQGLRLTPLQLECNFRSQAGIVSWVNGGFAKIFPHQVDIASGAVPLAEAVPFHQELPGPACSFHPSAERDDQAEAQLVLALVQQARSENSQQKVAILVRGRSHLQAILPLLRRQGISYQAQDIDQLSGRPAVFDLLGMVKALLCRADRLAWLSLLRAPWCGLTLHDLHTLVEDAGKVSLPSLIVDQTRFCKLSAAGQASLSRVWPVLERALAQRGRVPLRTLIEGTWLALGAPACYDGEGIEDAHLFFSLLEDFEQGGELPAVELLEERLDKLYAEVDGTADERLQVMTIHKAKGLEFDTVILPGLGKSTRSTDSPLLRWLEHPEYGLLLAPVAEVGSEEKDPIYQLIGRLEQEKQDLEAARLLYVATTRAVSRLHLLGHARQNSTGEFRPASGSLLEKLWPVVGHQFASLAVTGERPPQSYLPPPFQRLPGDWRLPAVNPIVLPQILEEQAASARELGADREAVFSGWESESKRHVGTLVHALLEQLARRGFESWAVQDCAARRQRIGRQLSQLGVPDSELSACRENVVAAVERTFHSEKGRWILQPHSDQACELPLTGLVAGRLVHAIIDRTFVDAGTRWIIDYKTSAPGPQESLVHFMQRELEHYRAQMEAYVALFQLQEEKTPIRAALYFPLIDGWCELPRDD